MKKTFTLTHPKTKYARLIDAVRNEVKRYLKRERGKSIAEGYVWNFACKFGPTAAQAKVINEADLSKAITAAETEQCESFYIEILAKKCAKAEQSYVKPNKAMAEQHEEAEPEKTADS
ncbi:MAG: DUF6172 family protein [Mariprofundaceae bacterium]|nr:DUF6172 family protein [Mariprofundaceae bacterium]